MLITKSVKADPPIQKKPKSSRSQIIAIAMLIVTTIFARWWVTRPLSPKQVAQRTAAALVGHDIESLLSLTMDEERHKLNLNNVNVTLFLDDLYYAKPEPKKYELEILNYNSVDQCIYLLNPVPKNIGDRPIPIAVTETDNGEWHLALGYMLYNVSARTNPSGSIFDQAAEMAVRSRKYGIRGTRLNTSGYSIVKGM